MIVGKYGCCMVELVCCWGFVFWVRLVGNVVVCVVIGCGWFLLGLCIVWIFVVCFGCCSDVFMMIWIGRFFFVVVFGWYEVLVFFWRVLGMVLFGFCFFFLGLFGFGRCLGLCLWGVLLLVWICVYWCIGRFWLVWG